MTTLTPEERDLGRANANTAIGVTRRDFLKTPPPAPALGAFYFGYKGWKSPSAPRSSAPATKVAAP